MNWQRIGGGLILVLLGGLVTNSVTDWLGPQTGISGVRRAQAQHADNDDMHPNVPLLEQRLTNLETANTKAEKERKQIRTAQSANTQTILDAIRENGGGN